MVEVPAAVVKDERNRWWKLPAWKVSCSKGFSVMRWIFVRFSYVFGLEQIRMEAWSRPGFGDL